MSQRKLSSTNKNAFFVKSGEEEGKQVLSGKLAPVGVGENIRRRCRRVNMVEILCTHV
jgi:hypothetical protein